MIACFFPPEGGAGVQRPFKFAKYLPSLGWDVTVISREITGKNINNEGFILDNSISYAAGDTCEIRIHRLSPSDEFKGLLRLDPYEEWSIAAANKAAELLMSTKFDCLFITMSPFSLVRAIPLIRSVCEVPIVLDFRDPWVFDGWQKRKSYIHWLYHYKNMRDAIRHSDGVIANTPEVGKIFKCQFPWLTSRQLTVIENGYDEEDFLDETPPVKSTDSKFLIVFAGTLLTELAVQEKGIKSTLKRFLKYTPERIDYSGRTLIHLITALNLIKKTDQELFKKIYVKCLGPTSDADVAYIKNAGVEEKIELCGYLPHSQSVKQIQNADALFLPLHGMAVGNRSRIVPGKTYEYLATGNTIIGCLPEGDALDLVKKSGNSVVANPTNPNDIAIALKNAEKLYRENKSKDFPLPWVKQYERKALTARLNNFLRSIAEFPGNT